MTPDPSEQIQLTFEHRELLLKYGHPFERLIGELSRSYNHDQTGVDAEAVLELCDHLEYAQQTGDGDLELW